MRGWSASLRRGRSGRAPRRRPPPPGGCASCRRPRPSSGWSRWSASAPALASRRGGASRATPRPARRRARGPSDCRRMRDACLARYRPREILTSRDTDLQPPFQPLPLTLEPNPDCEQAHETGGYLNYRQDDMVRGHGNQPPWKAAGRLPSTELGLQSLTLAELLADMRHWRARKAGCLAPCALPPPSPPPDASGAPVASALAAPGLASAAWSEVSSSSRSAAWSGVSSSSQSAARSGVCSTHCQPSPSPSPGPRPSPSSQAWPHP